MGNDLKLVQDYIGTIKKELVAGNATEHTHRPALKVLIEGLTLGVTATNEPSRIECGAPDFVVRIRAWDRRMNAWYLPLSKKNLDMAELIFNKESVL